MKIVVIGGSGLIGKKVVTNLRRHGHEVDPRGARLGQRVLGLGVGVPVAGVGSGHERIRPSTSSRLASMSATETSDSRHRRSSGSVLDARTLKCQSS